MNHGSDLNRDHKAAASAPVQPLPGGRGSVRSGFTLVELLVVIAVIGLLISILVPAVSLVRTRARETTTQGTFGTLQTAIETFKADGRVGGGYPPSCSDNPSGMPQGRVVSNPYLPMGQPTRLEISGAGLLVWALVGADFQGCPGFRTFRQNSSCWSYDTDATNSNDDPQSSGAYALHTDSELPLHPRSGRFVDTSKIPVSRANPEHGHFEVETEVEARDDMDLDHADRLYPMFLDSFGFPILYWRADPAGVKIADLDRSAMGTERGVYHWVDNGPLVADRGFSNQEEPLVLRPGNGQHLLDWQDIPDAQGYEDYSRGWFQYFIRNEQIQNKDVPHNPDTYLLVSPGEDGLYGTADDIANFPHNGVDQREGG